MHTRNAGYGTEQLILKRAGGIIWQVCGFPGRYFFKKDGTRASVVFGKSVLHF